MQEESGGEDFSPGVGTKAIVRSGRKISAWSL